MSANPKPFPPCFASWEHFEQWRVQETGEIKKWYCPDCTPEYQAKMIKQRRCNFPKFDAFNDDED